MFQSNSDWNSLRSEQSEVGSVLYRRPAASGGRCVAEALGRLLLRPAVRTAACSARRVLSRR